MTPNKRSKVKWAWVPDEDDPDTINLVSVSGEIDEDVYISEGSLNGSVYPNGTFRPEENVDPRLVNSELFSRVCFLHPTTMNHLCIKLCQLIELDLEDGKIRTGLAWPANSMKLGEGPWFESHSNHHFY